MTDKAVPQTKENDPDVVDMLDVARIAQDVDARDVSGPAAVKAVAPAKVNLYLEIGAKRPDGYHEVDTVMHALMLHDVLRMRLLTPDEVGQPAVKEAACAAVEGAPRVLLTCRSHGGVGPIDVAPADNIVTKAIGRLGAEAGRTAADVMRVHLDKHIPAQAGLGGGSADAAAALVAAARIWGIPENDPLIERVARSLGADVPFFLRGGCARLSGVGDAFDAALAPLKSPVVVVKPTGGVPTAAAYRAFDEDPHSIVPADRDAALHATAAGDVPLRNNLAAAAEGILPEIADVRAWAAAQPGVGAAMMSGSGAAVFACCASLDAATRLASAAQARGWWARSTSFSPLRAALVPNR